ncbi:DUF6528 family protein [Streptomyces sp. NPDC020875]|uniref:DUF6528 family protein n=1 Tax=Streptomyces sp. NPDC020875 TaxID=3154898 RepID=UPI0033DE18BC
MPINSRFARRSLLLTGAAALTGAAFRPLVSTAGAAAPNPAAALPPLLVGDQKSARVLLLDSAVPEWDPAATPSPVLWEFDPVGDSRYADLLPDGTFTYVSEAKNRTVAGQRYVLTTASYGFAAVVRYPDKSRYWGGRVTLATSGRTDDLNPHSIELLPTGDVAVASSRSGDIRLYGASQSPSAPLAFTAPLAGAHGVHWDPAGSLLWAVGDTHLVAYTLGGTPGSPQIAVTHTFPLPKPVPAAEAGGHDLNRVDGQPDLLWVSTASGLFQFSISRREFAPYLPPGCPGALAKVKAAGNAGTVLAFTAPDDGARPNWQTRRVRTGTGTAYTLVNGGIYKARWWEGPH